MWKRRCSIIFQLRHKKEADIPLLFAHIEASIDEPDFFLRKGIGWGLREASKSHPKEIRAFLADNKARLSPLSYKEGSKYV